jgi:hypothetical protein
VRMMVVIRLLVLIALAVVSVTPAHAHGAPAVEHHAISADHAHGSGPGHAHGSDPGELPKHGHDETRLCCASLSIQCGSGALAADGRWSPAEHFPVEIARGWEQLGARDGPLPEFEPPPPRG